MTASRVGAAVLAAGASSRLGRPKQLLTLGERPLIRLVTEQVCASSCAEVVVVLGAHADDVGAALSGLPIARLANDAWAEGMASSIRCAAAWAARSGLDALMIILGDQALLSAAHVGRLLIAYRAGECLVASRYERTLGPPALFGQAYYGRLGLLEGDEGARSLLRQGGEAIAVDWADGAFDIDRPSDVAAISLREQRR